MYKDLTFVFDVDGTLCPIKKENERYEDVVPYAAMVEKIREYKEGGARIVLLTSRNMRTYNGNIGLINANTAKVLLEWLDKWEIPYDEIIYGKPWPGEHGFYVDDRTVRPSEFISKSVDELDEIVRRDRCRS
ncbi:MAG: capsular biosynthesis protein [Lachnospiraceae bacterium]|nr:capsular biosynthesis protein [Lachnospiraceae bacterium]